MADPEWHHAAAHALVSAPCAACAQCAGSVSRVAVHGWPATGHTLRGPNEWLSRPREGRRTCPAVGQ